MATSSQFLAKGTSNAFCETSFFDREIHKSLLERHRLTKLVKHPKNIKHSKAASLSMLGVQFALLIPLFICSFREKSTRVFFFVILHNF